MPVFWARVCIARFVASFLQVPCQSRKCGKKKKKNLNRGRQEKREKSVG